MSGLIIDSVSKAFGKSVAVRPLSLEVRQGELACLLGPSGSGKTTLLRMIGGFEQPSSGRIFIGGADVARVPAERRPTAMVFQSHALWNHMNVFSNIAFGLQLRRVPRHELVRRVEAMIELVGLKGFERRYPQQLSGGQQQRVAIARSLVVEPAVLLMDEPFASLDQHLRERLREELRQIQRALGITTVFVTHGQEEAMAIADRIVVMSTGTIEQVGPPEEIYDRPATPFVAGFIGIMNMLDGRVAGGKAMAAGFSVPAELPDGPVILAVRPEDLTVAATGGVECAVLRAVNVGPSLLVHVRTRDGKELRTYCAKAQSIREGQILRLDIRAYTAFAPGAPALRWQEGRASLRLP